MSDNFCILPWVHFANSTNGKLRLCCNSKPADHKFYLHKTPIAEYWNSEFMQEIRTSFIKNKRHHLCQSCWTKEDNGLESLRQQSNTTYAYLNQDTSNSSNIPLPVSVDLKLGNYCNLSCRMCNSFSSSTYASELKQIYQQTQEDLGLNPDERHYVQSKWFTSQIFQDNLKQLLPHIKHAKFTGGEPFMVPQALDFIDQAVDSKACETMTLSVITNLSLISKKLLDKISKFQQVHFAISMDGVEQTYEYIRHPMTWDKFSSKIELLQEYPNILKDIYFTLQWHNIANANKTYEYACSKGIPIRIIPLYEPIQYDVKNLPVELKQLYLNQIKPISEFHAQIVAKLHEPAVDVLGEFLRHTKLKDQFKNQKFNQTQLYLDMVSVKINIG